MNSFACTTITVRIILIGEGKMQLPLFLGKEKVPMKKYLSLVLFSIVLSGCAAGPCYEAMKFRTAAETARGEEKAALLGKADAIQKECDAYNKNLQESQNRNARFKDHP